MLRFKNDAGDVSVVAENVGAVVRETAGVQRIWLSGGGTVTVHGNHEEIVKKIDDALGSGNFHGQF